MKKLDDILKGFDLMETWEDGTKLYETKSTHFVQFDDIEVHNITVYQSGNIDCGAGRNCDLIEYVNNELDEFHVYELMEIA